MSRKFDFAKWFGRSIAFIVIFSPLLLLQVSIDRSALEVGVKDENINECYKIKRQFFFDQCHQKILRKRTLFCENNSSPECFHTWIKPIQDIPSQGSPFWLFVIEIISSVLISFWAMGLTPTKIESHMPSLLANISTSDSYVYYRIPMAFVIFLGCYYLFQLVHGLYS